MTMMKGETVKRETLRICPIPGSTDFNILLLQKQIPSSSNINYLPVVNSKPTQLSIVNAVFLQSLAIADKFETECIVLTFDLAF